MEVQHHPPHRSMLKRPRALSAWHCAGRQANSPTKPLRIWMEVGDRDNLNMNALRDNMHDWVVANENMAKVLAAKG
jgi:hypothetical protein